jgi:hypothetical protein
MVKVGKLAVFMLLTLLTLTVFATADSKKGHNIYLKILKTPCGFSGIRFAHEHTQDEWENIQEAGKFADETNKICPKANIEVRYVQNVYDFVYEYAKDSGNMPSY